MRFLVILLLFLFSCRGEQARDELIVPAEKADSTLKTISGVWVDRSDPAHLWIISSSSIVDIYEGDTTSIKPAEAWTGFSVSGGMPFPSGGVIRIEDEPGNYFEFELVKVDSMYLDLLMHGSERQFSFIRQEKKDNTCDCGKLSVPVLVQQELMIRDTPDGEITGKMELGDFVWEITAVDREWVRVETPQGRKGWLRGNEFTIDLKKEKELTLKERADEEAPNSGFSIANNCITGCCGKWLRIEGQSKSGKRVAGWWRP